MAPATQAGVQLGESLLDDFSLQGLRICGDLLNGQIIYFTLDLPIRPLTYLQVVAIQVVQTPMAFGTRTT